MGSHRRSRRRRLLRAVLWGVAAVQVLEAVKLRARRDQVQGLPSTPRPLVGSPKLSVAAVPGTHVDQATLAAAAAELEATGAEVVDLVPGDIPADRALAYLRRMDLDRLREDPSYSPGGAGEAVVLHESVAGRMRLDEGAESLDRGDLMRRTMLAQRFAPGASVVRVAPGLRATPVSAADRWHELEQLIGWTRPHLSIVGPTHAFELAWLALLTAGPWLAPLPGLAALAAWCAQPALVFGGDAPQAQDGNADEAAKAEPAALNPPDLLGASLLRLPRAWVDNLATAAVGIRARWAAMAEQSRRPAPPVEREEDVARLFEPRRDTCPWCGSEALELLIEVPDLLQQKAGTYHLDKCRDCSHVFQNPQLTLAGLDRIYTDAYHGAGGETAEYMQARCMESYWGRAKAVARFTEPSRWLDVGSSYGHFFLAARRMFPKAQLDALDMGDAVDEGHRRGWVDNVHKGFFPELADSLPSYDVVSMHHYLEHTRDPRADLAAVDKVLEPGGYLMIEVPDPDAPWAARLGRYWWQWGQPEHLHFVTCDNLVAELSKTGYEVVSIQRGEPSWGSDLTIALVFWAQSVSRSSMAPWLPPPSTADRIKRAAVFGGLLPLFGAAAVIDGFDKARVQKTDAVSNVFRVVARKA